MDGKACMYANNILSIFSGVRYGKVSKFKPRHDMSFTVEDLDEINSIKLPQVNGKDVEGTLFLSIFDVSW